MSDQYILLQRDKTSPGFNALRWSAVTRVHALPAFKIEGAANMLMILTKEHGGRYEFFMVPALLWDEKEMKELTSQATLEVEKERAAKVVTMSASDLGLTGK